MPNPNDPSADRIADVLEHMLNFHHAKRQQVNRPAASCMPRIPFR